MGIFDPDEVITIYSLKEAIEDGALVEIFKKRWKELSGGKPIVATAGLFENVSLAGLTEIWNEYVLWRTRFKPKLPEEKRLFSTEMNHLTVWVIEDAVAFTLMYPEDQGLPRTAVRMRLGFRAVDPGASEGRERGRFKGRREAGRAETAFGCPRGKKGALRGRWCFGRSGF